MVVGHIRTPVQEICACIGSRSTKRNVVGLNSHVDISQYASAIAYLRTLDVDQARAVERSTNSNSSTKHTTTSLGSLKDYLRPLDFQPISEQLFKAPKDLRRIGDAIMVTSGESKEGKREDFEAVFPSLVEDLKQNATQYGIPAEALKWYEEVGLSSSEFQRPICLLFSHTVMFVLMLALDIVTKLQHPWW